MLTLIKQKPARDDKYLDFVREHICTECRHPHHIEAHHVYTGGMSTKCSDYDTIPLCGFFARDCHAKVDQRKDVPQRFKDKIAELNKEWEDKGGVFKDDRRTDR